MDHVLLDDGALVQVVGDEVGGGADELDAAIERLTIGSGPDEGGQEGVVDVEDLARIGLDETRCQHPHVLRQDHIIGLVAVYDGPHLLLVFGAAQVVMADGVERNVELASQLCQGVVVADHRHYVHVQSAGVVLHQDVAEAVGLLGHQDDDALLAGLDQATLGAGGQGIVEIRQQGLVVEASFQLGAHEEAAILVIHELVVLDDVELVLVADVGDLGDEALGIGAIRQQYFLFHVCHRFRCVMAAGSGSDAHGPRFLRHYAINEKPKDSPTVKSPWPGFLPYRAGIRSTMPLVCPGLFSGRGEIPHRRYPDPIRGARERPATGRGQQIR